MNLVYEQMDRILVLEEVSNILETHPPMMGINCRCEVCMRASEVGKVARYSPKVAKILSKGEDMTTEEYKYLLKRGLTKKEISKETGIAPVDLPNKNGSYRKLTLHKYESLRSQGFSIAAIGKAYGMSPSAMRAWRGKRGLIKVVIEGLDPKKYIELKTIGMPDAEIIEQYNTSATTFTMWKYQNFSEQARKSLEIRSGRKKGQKNK